MIDYKRNTSRPEDIILHFKKSGSSFVEGIEVNQNLEDYSNKLYEKAQRHELWNNGELVGLLAFYRNDSAKEIYITSISISEEFQGLGYGKNLFGKMLAESGLDQIDSIRLEVRGDNQKALEFYNSLNFVIKSTQNQSLIMERVL